jgi:c-di-GMP-binding flagellar brake protein YcgR
MSDTSGTGERRRHYRMRVPPAWGLEVRVTLTSGEVFPAELLDLSAGGAGIRLLRTLAPPLRAGDEVALELRAVGSPRTFRVQAVAQRGSLLPQGYVYGLRFVEPLELGAGAPQKLREALNRRRLARVRLTPTGSVQVAVAPLRQPRQAVVVSALDLSGGGLAFTAAPQAHLLLGSHYDFALELSLPDLREKLRVVAHVRYRVRVPQGWRYGVEFDRRRTESFPRIQALILAYVEKSTVDS